MKFRGLLLLCLWPWSCQGLPAATDPSLKPVVLRKLAACQDAYYRLEFDLAEQRAQEAIQAAPEHPLPSVILAGALLARIQDEMAAKALKPETRRRFDEAAAAAVAKSEARLQKTPDAFANLYLGTALGTRGLVALYQGSYLTAYGDGQKAESLLREAVRLDPGLDEAYVGLGHYSYYCGRITGLVRMMLDLKGDVREGIAMLERSAKSKGYAGLAAEFSLARIYATEETDYQRAAARLRPLLERFPRNYDLHAYARATIKGLGSGHPEAQALLKAVVRPWEQGWQPPVYAGLEDPRQQLVADSR